MSSADKPSPVGRVASLHLHPAVPGAAMREVTSIETVAALGIQEDDRYFGRKSRSTGQPTVRQVSLIEREQIAEHAQALGLAQIEPGAVRANIESVGANWVDWVGREVQIGEAVLLVCEARKPCAKMDAVCQGLRQRMESNRQGVLAQVLMGGRISVGDPISLVVPKSRPNAGG